MPEYLQDAGSSAEPLQLRDELSKVKSQTQKHWKPDFQHVPDFFWKCRAGTFTKMPSGTGCDSKWLVLVKSLNRCLLARLKSERYVIIQKSARINSLASALDMQNMPDSSQT